MDEPRSQHAGPAPGSQASARAFPASAGWSTFRRHDLSAVVRAVRDVAASGDPGAYGYGVEIVIESPPLRWWQRIRDRSPRDSARIAITGDSGAVGYPIHVRLVTGIGAGAARRIDRRDGWATSITTVRTTSDSTRANSTRADTRIDNITAGSTRAGSATTGEAILMLKRGTRPGYEAADAAAEVVSGTVAALDDLHPFSPPRGWRFTIDRRVRRQ